MHRICLISYQVKDYKVTYLCFTFCLQECQCSLSVKSVPSPYCAPQNYCECPNLPFYNLKTVFSLKFGLSNCHSILSSFFYNSPLYSIILCNRNSDLFLNILLLSNPFKHCALFKFWEKLLWCKSRRPTICRHYRS